MSRTFLESTAANAGLPLPTELLRPRSGAMIRASGKTRALEARIRRLLADPSSPIDPDYETTIAVGLLEAAAGIDDESLEPPQVRSRAVTKTLAYLEAHSNENVNVGQLCAETGSHGEPSTARSASASGWDRRPTRRTNAY